MKNFPRLALLLIAAMLLASVPFAVTGQEPAGSVAPHVTDGPVARNGAVAQVDYPMDLWKPNEGGNDRSPSNPRGEPGKGAGLCVYRSFVNEAHWHGHDLEGFFEWMKHRPGGSYPPKFAADYSAYCREKGIPELEYLQVQTRDSSVREVLDLLDAAMRNGHMVGVTYSRSATGRYPGQDRIGHMLNLMAARVQPGNLWATMDNNYKGYEWKNEDLFADSFAGYGGGWALILLDPGPPPVPIN